jgi:type IV pilus assembly protein PilC
MIITKQIKNPRLAKIINEVRTNLDYGFSISESLLEHKKYFNPLVTSLISVGEKSGTLPRVLVDLEASLLESIELKGKIKGAMIYPVILIFISLALVVFMLTFILPKITVSFVKTGVEIPALTRFMMNLSDFMINHYPLILITLFVIAIGALLFKKTDPGKMFFANISIRLPIFGYIEKQNNTIYFIESLYLLLDSGMLMLEALETSADIVPNILYKKEIIRIKNEVETGIKLSNAMGLAKGEKEQVVISQLFPEDLIHMVNVGEEAGTIGKSIMKVGVNYKKDLRRAIANMMSAMEPFIIIFVGSLVGTIVIAMMLPFFELTKVAKNM